MKKWFVLIALATSIAYAAEADPLAELAALGDQMTAVAPEGGGSIRAKRDVDVSKLDRLKDPENIEARVEELKMGRFPAVALRVRVVKPAQTGIAKSVKTNDSLVIFPNYKVDAGKVDFKDEGTARNAGAFFLQNGDKVIVKLDKQLKQTWRASFIERK
jgi:hypothetical protein